MLSPLICPETYLILIFTVRVEKFRRVRGDTDGNRSENGSFNEWLRVLDINICSTAYVTVNLYNEVICIY